MQSIKFLKSILQIKIESNLSEVWLASKFAMLRIDVNRQLTLAATAIEVSRQTLQVLARDLIESIIKFYQKTRCES